MRGADVQAQLLGRPGDAAGPVQNGIDVALVRLAVLALRPYPGSVRPLLAGTPVDAELLSRLGDSSQTRAGSSGFFLKERLFFDGDSIGSATPDYSGCCNDR
jgi:hypothetical protein